MVVAAFIVSVVAALISAAALFVSIYHKHIDRLHGFYSKIEENLSDVLFGRFPKSLESFLDCGKKQVNVKAYGAIDDCFHELYRIVKTLDYLEDEEFRSIRKAISNLEDSLMLFKNEGYIEDKIEFLNENNRELHKIVKAFIIKH